MQLFSKIWRVGLVTEPVGPADVEAVEIGRALDQRIKTLFGRALAIREVDAGSCNGCVLEITGLTNPIYDIERTGMHFVTPPPHANILINTGPVTPKQETPHRKTYEPIPDPKDRK